MSEVIRRRAVSGKVQSSGIKTEKIYVKRRMGGGDEAKQRIPLEIEASKIRRYVLRWRGSLLMECPSDDRKASQEKKKIYIYIMYLFIWM